MVHEPVMFIVAGAVNVPAVSVKSEEAPAVRLKVVNPPALKVPAVLVKSFILTVAMDPPVVSVPPDLLMTRL